MKTLKTEHEKYQLSNVHIHHLSSSCSVGRVGWSVDQSAKAQMAGRLVGHNTPHHTTPQHNAEESEERNISILPQIV